MPAPSAAREVNLLMMDDDLVAAYGYARVLRPFGAVTIVATVAEAICWLERGAQIDAVLLLSTAHAYEAELLTKYLRHDRPDLTSRLVVATTDKLELAADTTMLPSPVRAPELLQAVRQITQAHETPSAELRPL